MTKLAWLAAGLLISTAAVAQEQSGSSAQGATTAQSGERNRNVYTNEKGERIICRMVARTESRMGRRRECRTREQWNDVADNY